MIFDGRTLQSTPDSGARAGYDGHKKKRGSKVHMAVDTIGHLPALLVTPANEQERAQVYELSDRVREVTTAFADQGYTGDNAEQDAAENEIKLEVVKRPEGSKGFVLLPRRWVVERSFGWMARFRRLARDFERLPEVLAGFHFVAFVILMVKRVVALTTKVHNRLLSMFRLHKKLVTLCGPRKINCKLCLKRTYCGPIALFA